MDGQFRGAAIMDCRSLLLHPDRSSRLTERPGNTLLFEDTEIIWSTIPRLGEHLRPEALALVGALFDGFDPLGVLHIPGDGFGQAAGEVFFGGPA